MWSFPLMGGKDEETGNCNSVTNAMEQGSPKKGTSFVLPRESDT